MTSGKVYLVGAGPGDPKLLTLRAFELIRSADAVVFDRLISEPILGLIPERAERIYVGKDHHCKEGITQAEINEILVRQAKLGRVVVRLKGGDPLLFSRGGEEAESLLKEGIDFEIVPGVSSALGAPAYAGIPLTHRQYSSSVAIVTGHQDSKAEPTNWARLASSVDTIVILMGVKSLRRISWELMAGGLSGDTPVAAIERGTTEKQRTTLFSLKDAALGLADGRISAPSAIVVGEVTKFARSLGWTGKSVAELSDLKQEVMARLGSAH